MSGEVEAEELAILKERYGRQCRIMTNVGEFAHIVNLHPENMDISIKFQLKGTYPAVIPDIFVLSKMMLPEANQHLQSHLTSQAARLVGSPMVDQLYQMATQWLEEQGLDLTVHVKEGKDGGKGGKQKRGKKTKKAKETEEDLHDEKKPSMKTAEDVIKRIRWDGDLNQENFIVAYIDRFIGVVEKSFGSFTWEDIASADYNDLAIPKHRIQYFRYKKVIFWDKTKRLDDMFGSTGSGKTITDVIEQYELEQASKKEEGEESSDDDFEIITGANEYIEENKADDHKRPNYFFCVRVMDPEIIEGVKAMQYAIVGSEESYNGCCTEPEKLHITLCTVGLDNEDQVKRACQFLYDANAELAEIAKNKIKAKLEGVDNFYDSVLYAKAKPVENADFINFADHFRKLVMEAGVEVKDNYDFVPHMTIMKVLRPMSKLMGTAKIKRSVYEGYLDMYFGYQLVDAVHLCAMTADVREDGFYRTPASISLI